MLSKRNLNIDDQLICINRCAASKFSRVWGPFIYVLIKLQIYAETMSVYVEIKIIRVENNAHSIVCIYLELGNRL